MATGVLGLSAPRDGIDLLGIAKGRRAAQNDNYEDIRRMQEQEVFAFEREGRMDTMRENQFARQAAAYTAPLLASQQRAADAGVNNLDWLLQQRTAILSDPNFLNMPPEAQQKVLQQIGATATAVAQQQISAGDVSAAQRLYSALGVNYASPTAQVAQSGDPRALIEAANKQGGNFTISADGRTVTNAAGQVAPIENVAYLLAQSPNNLSNTLPAFAEAARIQQAEQLRLQQERESRAAERMRLLQQLQFGGYTQGPDGLWRNALNPAMPPISLDFPQGSVIGGVTGDSLAPVQTGVPAAAPAATTTAPAGAAVTPAAGAAAPVGMPAFSSPVVNADLAAIAAMQGAPSAMPFGSPGAAGGTEAIADAFGGLFSGPGAAPAAATPVQQAVAQAAAAYATQAATPEGAREISRRGSVARMSAVRGIEDRLLQISRELVRYADGDPARQSLLAEATRLSTAISNLRAN